MSPGGALVRRLRLDCALAGEWGGGKGNAVPGDEQGEEGGGPDHPARRGTKTLPRATSVATARLETGSPLGLSLPRHRRPTQARRGRCLQMPGACPAQNARLPSYLTCKAREPRRQRPD